MIGVNPTFLPEIRKILSSQSKKNPWILFYKIYQIVDRFISPDNIRFYLITDCSEMVYPIILFQLHDAWYLPMAFTEYKGIYKYYDSLRLLKWLACKMGKLYNTKIERYCGDSLPISESLELSTKVELTGVATCAPINKARTISRQLVTDNITDIPVQYIEGYNGVLNSIIKYQGSICRMRVEGIVHKKTDIYLGFKSDGHYKLPGGAINPNDKSHAATCIREAQEEIRITTGSPRYIGTYLEIRDEPDWWVQQKLDPAYWWNVRCSEVYNLFYKKRYGAYVAPEDRDELIKYGKFYRFDDVYDRLYEVHRTMLDNDREKQI